MWRKEQDKKKKEKERKEKKRKKEKERISRFDIGTESLSAHFFLLSVSHKIWNHKRDSFSNVTVRND